MHSADTMNTTQDGPGVLVTVITASMWTIVTLLILLLNALCLIILPKVNSINDATKVFLAFMTLGDLNLAVFIYLPMIGVSISGGTWPFGAFCFAQAWILRQGLPMNMIAVLLVTIDRYLAIVHPLRYCTWVTAKRAKIIACCTALLTHLYAMYYFLSDREHIHFNKTLKICVFGVDNSTTYAITFSMGLTWFLCHLAMYVRILKIASRHANRIAGQHNAAWVHNASPNRRSFATIGIINVILFVCWVPFSIVCVAEATGNEVPGVLVTISRILLATVSWVNVIVYYVRNEEFKRAVHNLLISTEQWCSCYKRES